MAGLRDGKLNSWLRFSFCRLPIPMPTVHAPRPPRATELRLYAERKGGEMLAEMPKAAGTRSQLRGDVPVGGSAPTPPEKSETPTLKQLKITKTQSSKWQKLALLTVEKLKIRVEHAKARVKGMTTSALAKN